MSENSDIVLIKLKIAAEKASISRKIAILERLELLTLDQLPATRITAALVVGNSVFSPTCGYQLYGQRRPPTCHSAISPELPANWKSAENSSYTDGREIGGAICLYPRKTFALVSSSSSALETAE